MRVLVTTMVRVTLTNTRRIKSINSVFPSFGHMQ